MKGLFPKPVKRLYHLAWALLSILIYGRPSKKLRVIGVTGTDGKTTTTSLIYEGLKASGKKVAMINGLRFVLPSKEWKNHSDNSTPGRLSIRKFLKQAVDEGCEVVILEATSWGLEQHRLFGVQFDVAVMTNFAHEHIDLHGSLQRYRAMKGKLFHMLSSGKKAGQKKVAIINKDDDSASYFARFKAEEQLFYSREKEVDITAKHALQEDGLVFDISFKGKTYPARLKIKGDFNISNALAALGACYAVGANIEQALEGMQQLEQVPGRMEFIYEGQPFDVVVDFAHTAQAFQAIFSSMRKKIGPDKKIIAVYGSAGGRDPGRRMMIGEIAGELVDYSVLTTDDPRTEDPKAIADVIAQGLAKHGKKEGRDFEFIQDRAEAIKKGISLAQPGDAVLMLSMGDYDVMYVGHGKMKWSDRDAAKQALKTL